MNFWNREIEIRCKCKKCGVYNGIYGVGYCEVCIAEIEHEFEQTRKGMIHENVDGRSSYSM